MLHCRHSLVNHSAEAGSASRKKEEEREKKEEKRERKRKGGKKGRKKRRKKEVGRRKWKETNSCKDSTWMLVGQGRPDKLPRPRCPA